MYYHGGYRRNQGFIKACSMKREEKNQVKNYVSKNILQSGLKEIKDVMGYVMRECPPWART